MGDGGGGRIARRATLRPMRTEHAGAKNGGGYWGTREEAKRRCRKLRRRAGRRESKRPWGEPEPIADRV